MNSKELEQSIRSVLQRKMAAAELRLELEQLAIAEISFSGFTWPFGPEFYRRNRILFRPFILSRFSSYLILPKWRTEVIRWKGDRGKILDMWLVEVDKNDDADLFRRLYEWKLWLARTLGWCLRIHSWRRASIGFNRAARRAGV